MPQNTRTSTRDDNPIRDLNFTSLFRLFGWKSLVFSPKFFIALVLSSAVKSILCELSSSNFVDVSKYISSTGAQISGALLGIVIAGLAIITALANGRLLHILLRGKVLPKLLFPFWLAASFWGLALGLCLLLYPVISLLDRGMLEWLEFITVFMFTYSTLASIALVGNTIQIGIIAAEYDPD